MYLADVFSAIPIPAIIDTKHHVGINFIEHILNRIYQMIIVYVRTCRGPFQINKLPVYLHLLIFIVGHIWDIIVKNRINLTCMLGQVVWRQASIPAHHFDTFPTACLLQNG
ncbi:hypothetical protein PUATCC27989T_03117 [Phytobacter ursingii]|nr:hypothetical protein PUATCC27989T_03117 [Phytobacter ursingii]